jgi:hypothetical protein
MIRPIDTDGQFIPAGGNRRSKSNGARDSNPEER